jgi:predicted O-methyltransferase YrrM
MEKYGDRVTFVRRTGESASHEWEEQSVDFVYIDGLHDYASISRDIELWYPKVRTGGIIAGHDYHPDIPDVIRAVDEFREKTGVEMFFTEDQMPSWWMRKI